ncbi:MAG: Asp-tRNA(Asn)/Glu-tRNA(Gln) amidotransferase subunit GatC [Armatimonadetes bacterium]|nr:Asp-tRNA(Asn)/Glu-tRNA(Gln) amidotransferase subunit GatC [Armatimonadota bacterium]NIM23327.1 Asp-tRNA(Asn)/Glu-tRNA(Gln) amidotransferase subunit GatC [Armatimonadota bacterium]NIM67191.1 Asp-tRNA(Asn)/Glu-tRNA(Gln) amidotransferase subunit GatC [Armatimonadota bacterium]NIM75716.1 Asp-tRNA(Asn)/Glu-tRNA(Gln) amidotransferase subunit GatC [Armatimonadota bacterium]NIN05380.1 Asp-tRNA(Asn)/Glu-tRNA(Gln) amidotransferase subunit GatC [Armatimonadota bacterium]
MPLTPEEVDHVALLARLELTDEERSLFTSQLSAILDYFQQLRELDTTGVPPTSHVVPLQNVLREDTSAKSLPQEEALANAPEQRQDCFLVPRVIE